MNAIYESNYTHKCKSCKKHPATCDAASPLFAVDRKESCDSILSDTVLWCGEYEPIKMDEPSKTAEELVQQIWDECVTSPGAYVEFDNYGAAKLIQSALDAYAKAKVEEAADRFCTICPERDVADGGTVVCESDWNGVCCPKLAAILGREDTRKGEEGRG